MFRFAPVVPVLASLLVAVSVADAGAKKKKPLPPQGPIIASVSADSITVTDNNASQTVAITRFTEILFKGQKATLADLQPGMRVSVTLGTDPTKAARINASDPPVAHPSK